MSIRSTLIVISLAATLAGCASRGLPKYDWIDPDTATAQLAKQDEQLKTLIAQGSVTLTDPKGKTVRLEAAIAAVFPDYLRLRAWKLQQAVFDLTLKPEGVWLYIPEEMKKNEQVLPAGAGAADFAKGFASLHGEFFRAINLEIEDRGGKTFYLRRRLDNGMVLRAKIDRDTLTIREHTLSDSQGKQRFSVTYEKYRLIDNIPVASRLVAKSEQGTIQVDLDDIQVNMPTAAGAFIPPKRAERLP